MRCQKKFILPLIFAVLSACVRAESEQAAPASALDANAIDTMSPLHEALRNRGRSLILEKFGAADFDGEVINETLKGEVVCGRGIPRSDRRERYYISMAGRVWVLVSQADDRWTEYCTSGRAL